MAFTVEDFQDLLGLLDQHPEWQAELRRRLLSDEFLQLPALVRQLTEAQVRTEQRLEALAGRVDALAEAQVRTEERLNTLIGRVDALAEAQARTEEWLNTLIGRVDALVEAQVRTEQQLQALIARGDWLTNRVADNSGELLESRYARKGAAYFSPIALRLRPLDVSALADRLQDAVEAGVLTEGEKDEVLRTDVVLEGRRRADGAEVYLLVEVSYGIGADDITRAAARGQVLAKLGRPVVPVVAGNRFDALFSDTARAHRVWWVVDGHAEPPEE